MEEIIDLVANTLQEMHETFVETTNPETEYKDLLDFKVFKSVVIHSVVYLLVLYLFLVVVQKHKISNDTLLKFGGIIAVIMSFSYVLRLFRAKNVYSSLIEKGIADVVALRKTNELMENAYFTWYFMA